MSIKDKHKRLNAKSDIAFIGFNNPQMIGGIFKLDKKTIFRILFYDKTEVSSKNKVRFIYGGRYE